MFCSNCGNELQNDVKFCPNCGSKTDINSINNEGGDARVEAAKIKSDGDIYLGKQDYHKAIEIYSQAIKKCSTYEDAYNARGVCYRSLGEQNIAFEDFSTAINLNSQFWKPYLNRSIIYNCLKSYNQALSDINNAIKYNLSDGSLYYQRAITYYFLENYNQSYIDCDKALQMHAPNNQDINNLKQMITETIRDDKVLGVLNGVGDFAKGFLGGVLSGLLNNKDDDDD
jgi:tetratricopeptide (TPR) repeat protein